MKKTILLSVAAIMTVMATSCDNKQKTEATDFITAVSQKDTAKINQAISPRTGAWEGVSFASVSPENMKIEEQGEGQYKVTLGDSAYFVFTETQQGGYKVDKVKNIFISNKDIVSQTLTKGDLPNDYDDIDAMNAVQKLKAAEVAEALQKERDEEVAAKIRKLYSKYVFGMGDFSSEANKLCTTKMLSKLKAADEFGNGNYAMNALIGGAQDFDETDGVTSVSSIGDGWYLVKYRIVGTTAKIKIKAVEDGGDVFLDDYK